MTNKAQKYKLQRKVVEDVVDDTVRELRQITTPDDFTADHAYNLLISAIQFRVLSGLSVDEVNEELHRLVDEACDDFVRQVLD